MKTIGKLFKGVFALIWLLIFAVAFVWALPSIGVIQMLLKVEPGGKKRTLKPVLRHCPGAPAPEEVAK